MVIGRVLGWLLLLSGLAIFGYDVWQWWTGSGGPEGRFTLTSIAEVWAAIDANSLVGLGSLFQQRLFPGNPELYSDWVVPALSAPAVLPPAVLGLFFLILFKRRRRPRLMRLR